MRNLPAGELLEDIEDRGYPDDYLCARLRGRRARMTTEWKTLAYEAVRPASRTAGEARGGAPERSAEGIWARLLREHRWVYSRMHGGLRALFAHYFLYAELRTIFISLRHSAKGLPGEAEDLLSASILSRKIKDILETGGKHGNAVVSLERIFRGCSREFSGLAGAMETGGQRGFEETLTNRYLAHVAVQERHPVLRSFFARIIDARNILALSKAIRTGSEAQPAFLAGGTVTSDRCRSVLKGGDHAAVGALVREATGMRTVASDSTTVENALYRGITKWLRKAGRDPLGAGLMLEYLWRCSMEAVNLGILARTREIDRESVLAELVY